MSSESARRIREWNEQVRQLSLTRDNVLVLEELAELGMRRRTIQHWIEQGRFVPILKGSVALPGARLGLRGRCRAATGSVDSRVVVSHASALAIHGLVRDPWAVHLTGEHGVYRDSGSSRWESDSFGFRVIRHETRSLPDDHVTEVSGIRVTTVERALRDYAAMARPADLTKALVQGEKERAYCWDKLRAIAMASNGQKGVGMLRTEIDLWEQAFVDTGSDDEIEFLLMLREYTLPMPEVNVRLGEYVPDFLWRHLGLAAELDPYGTHSGIGSHRQDHRKGIVLETGGLRLIRFTGEDLRHHRPRTAKELRIIMEQQAELLGCPLFPPGEH